MTRLMLTAGLRALDTRRSRTSPLEGTGLTKLRLRYNKPGGESIPSFGFPYTVDSEWAYIERDWVTRGGAHSSVLLLGLGVDDCTCDKLPVYKCCSAGCFKSRTLTWE